MSIVHQDPWLHLFAIGMQYYIVGRAAARGHQVPVAGNLLHHAVEMLLKGELSRTLSLEEIKKQYNHFLVRAWNAFKTKHPDKDLSGFDQLIADLDRFEKIRYPDEWLKHGAVMFIDWDRSKSSFQQRAGRKLPEYCIYMNEVDALVARVLRVCQVNPSGLCGSLNPEAVRFLQYRNGECEGWVPPQPVPKQE